MELKTAYDLFTKCWLLYKKYYQVEINDESAVQLVNDIREIGNGYDSKATVQLALATLSLIEENLGWRERLTKVRRD